MGTLRSPGWEWRGAELRQDENYVLKLFWGPSGQYIGRTSLGVCSCEGVAVGWDFLVLMEGKINRLIGEVLRKEN